MSMGMEALEIQSRPSNQRESMDLVIADERTSIVGNEHRFYAESKSNYSSLLDINPTTNAGCVVDRTRNLDHDGVLNRDCVTRNMNDNYSALPPSSPQLTQDETQEDEVLATMAAGKSVKEPGKCTRNSWSSLIRAVVLNRKYKSMNLENKGSVARDHLALERTFLAWLRTSLTFASIGIALSQLFRLKPQTINSAGRGDPNATPTFDGPSLYNMNLSKPLGITFLSISVVTLLLGFNRYFQGQYCIIHGSFPASRGSIILMAVITFTLMIASLTSVVVML